ncbi:hypothetical protein ACFPL7_20340 [Dongia soli]|uniref:Uncharacterized protein n=1 Tax=Dongia soli TaxID=600628 RepID=A0ABU5E6N3_9PROT|nr:hypothetical protein [Dongia soli]MDY0881940.1 hypothetical protein [Dongia soli]
MSGSAFNYNVASGALLPNQGMSVGGTQSKRVYDWKSFRAKAGAAQPAATAPTAPAKANAAPASALARGAVSQGPGLGAASEAALNRSTNLVRPSTIAGTNLRPGSIDQSQFKAMLASASLGVNPSPNIRSANGSPVIGGRQLTSPLPAITGHSPLAPAGILAAQEQAGTASAAGTAPAVSAGMAGGATGAMGGAPDGIQTLTAAQFAALTGAPIEGPAGDQVNADFQPGSAAGPPIAIPPAVLPAENASADGIPPDALTMSDDAIPPDGPAEPADADKDDDGVLKLNRIPDRETRQEYAAKGIKWKLVDDPEADKLFFGEDGKFGWDDFVDLINPLQHIPGINAIYRELTGDQIHGAAELLGAMPFGPLSTLGAIANIAVKSTTGRDIGGNVLAMIIGDDKSPATDLAARGKTKPVDGGTASAVSIAGRGATEQTAALRTNWSNGRGRDNEADA